MLTGPTLTDRLVELKPLVDGHRQGLVQAATEHHPSRACSRLSSMAGRPARPPPHLTELFERARFSPHGIGMG